MEYLHDEQPVEQVAEETAVPSVEPIPNQTKPENWQKRLFRDARDVLYILTVFMLVYILCFRTVVVVGDSMFDTLIDGDRLLLINNLLYFEPQQGDIVVASKDSFRDGECIIKRVIAKGGQKVDINFETGMVFVDDVVLDEAYLYTATLNPEGMEFPLVVPEGCLFVMGDNRMESMDSRDPRIGFIDEREILGKAIFLMIPGDPDGPRNPQQRDFGRIGVIG